MGATSSVLLPDENADEITELDFHPSKNKEASNRRNVKRIFEPSNSTANLDIMDLLNGDPVTPEVREILVKALSGFFFLQSSADDANSKMDLLIKGMKKESFDENHLVITEGESGNKLYVVESGNLEVTINGSSIRDLTKGSLLGELALLYDAPRSATVQCKCKCVLWSLTRDIFKKIQTISATANQIQRAKWLVSSPELACLSAVELSRLVGTLQVVQYEPGAEIFKEGQITHQIILIEKGNCSITSKLEGINNEDRKNIDKKFNILRPLEGKRRSVGQMTALQLNKFLANETSDTIPEGEEVTSVDQLLLNIKPPESTLCEVYEGCMIGTGGLRGKALLPDCWKWIKDDKEEGAVSPLTMTAISPVTGLVFTVDVFENLFGPIAVVLKQYGTKHIDKEIEKPEKQTKKEMVFDSTKFKQKYVLGSGSFGVVTLGEYRTDKGTEPLVCALKSLSKLAVIETGQLRHVMDERRLLAFMDSSFIMKLYGTYQTPHTLVMVTEPLNCGDLWSVIYETSPFCENCGLPFNLVAFYTANLIWGLTHIHEKGVIYRDLKPENIMLDEKGYLRIIDFGFSKRVPYTKKDANGVVKVFAKTYTLCGTPGYLNRCIIFIIYIYDIK